jgi:hypothetical protein
MTRQQRHRNKRRKQGLCNTEGCKKDSKGHYYCSACRARRRVRWQTYYANNADWIQTQRLIKREPAVGQMLRAIAATVTRTMSKVYGVD